MGIFHILLALYIGLTLIIAAVDLFYEYDNLMEYLNQYLNPVYVYRHHKVNHVGCFMLSLAYYLYLIWFVLPYWFYILCTVGRR